MKKVSFILVAVLMLAFQDNVAGQNVKKIFNKDKEETEATPESDVTPESEAEEKSGRSAEDVVRSGVNKGLDLIFGKQKNDNQDVEAPAPEPEPEAPQSTSRSRSNDGDPASAIGRNALMNAMGFSTGTANVKPAYEFDGFIEMTLTNYENGKAEEESVVYKTFTDSKSLDYALEFKEQGNKDKSIIIFDAENGVMLTLSDSDGEKSGFAMSFSPDQEDAVSENQEVEEDLDAEEISDPYEVYKTGKSKKILGYSCDEYRIESEEEDGVVTMWITEELNKDMKKTYLQNSAFMGLFVYAYAANGTVLEYIIEDKSNNDKSVMTVTDIDLNKRNTVSTVGYSIMNMGGIPDDETDEE